MIGELFRQYYTCISCVCFLFVFLFAFVSVFVFPFWRVALGGSLAPRQLCAACSVQSRASAAQAVASQAATVSTLASQAAAKGFVCSQPDRSHQDIFCLPPTLSIVFLHLPLLLPPKGFVHIEARRRMPNKGNRIYKIVKQKYREAVGRGLLRKRS